MGSRALLRWGQLDIVPHAVRYSALGIEISLGHKISRLIVLLDGCFGSCSLVVALPFVVGMTRILCKF